MQKFNLELLFQDNVGNDEGHITASIAKIFENNIDIEHIVDIETGSPFIDGVKITHEAFIKVKIDEKNFIDILCCLKEALKDISRNAENLYDDLEVHL